MAADKICCVLECKKSREDGVILHKFPNPKYDPTRFQTWIQAVGGNLKDLEDMYVFKYRRICHAHFESRYWTRSKMLSNIAIPTLQMQGDVAQRIPLAEVTNKNDSFPTHYMEETAIASTSSKMHELATSSTSNSKLTKSEKTQMRHSLPSTLKKKVKSLNVSKETFSKRLTSLAAIYKMLQLRECVKHKMGKRFTPDEKVMSLHFFKRGPRAYTVVVN